jgi:hypothetical protein
MAGPGEAASGLGIFLLFVGTGSTDDTRPVAERPETKVVDSPKGHLPATDAAQFHQAIRRISSDRA